MNPRVNAPGTPGAKPADCTGRVSERPHGFSDLVAALGAAVVGNDLALAFGDLGEARRHLLGGIGAGVIE